MSDLVERYYRDVAPTYDVDHHVAMAGARDFLAELRGRLSRALEHRRDVLEIGAGTGFVSNLLAERQGTLVLTDASTAMLARNPAASRAPAVCCRTEDLPFADASFDAVVGNNTFYLVRDKARAARSIDRVLRPGGRLILSEMNPSNPLWPAMFVVNGRWFERSVYEVFPWRMRSAFSATALAPIEIERWSWVPYFSGERMIRVLRAIPFRRLPRPLRDLLAVRIWYVYQRAGGASGPVGSGP